jgi:hypothetical protein
MTRHIVPCRGTSAEHSIRIINVIPLRKSGLGSFSDMWYTILRIHLPALILSGTAIALCMHSLLAQVQESGKHRKLPISLLESFSPCCRRSLL